MVKDATWSETQGGWLCYDACEIDWPIFMGLILRALQEKHKDVGRMGKNGITARYIPTCSK
ncbi:uncharacterized protein G2W53_007117 [Senna tora]|uniref:Uncharacterized protein n=1 Tax=Senna tora TaxID=362788 RepID=A0A835CFD1_9FABA|nr:uncharacterized protein G2W53_007117 [Senna tora]